MIRLIARLDIKGSRLIKGIQFEGVRVIGDPQNYAQKYYDQGIDELLYIDTVASLYGRNNLSELLAITVNNLFVPLTAGGGIRSLGDAESLLLNGADKIAINTEAVKNPHLITDLANRFGSQCVVVSIQAKKHGTGWEAYTECGREHTGTDAVSWAKQAADIGAGEILLTSVDKDGTLSGFDTDLVAAISPQVPVPVIASGGLGTPKDFINVVTNARADAVASGAALHYERTSILEIKQLAYTNQIEVRMI